ncbi:MAG: S-adenosylmethionine--diacylglycerol 3-amino-3-carboxypropyl transferase [Chloracidobacterium sp. CP2_5A]|nr:MAG: S-adenosylmethionine--diacylglycerol 3-amino-3-carboxypropyl transferase [Chloracidobacterium sp. CP2_5A]
MATDTADTAQLLRAAVHQSPITSKQGLLERLFTVYFDAFVYNQIWEDPRVDLAALELTPESRILTISSGGCNVLNYLVCGPAHITAVDLNRYHLALLRLKLAAARHLPDYESFFRMFGEANDLRNVKAYDTYLSAHLDDATRAFWEGLTMFGKRRVHFFADNLYDHARNGFYLRFLEKLAHLMGIYPDRLTRLTDPVERGQAFDETIGRYFDHWLVRSLSKLPFIVFGLGIPPRQYEAMRRETPENILAMYRRRVRRFVCDFPIEENYFAWQALTRRYDTEHRRAIPEYLKPEHFETLRANAPRVTTEVASLTAHLRKQPAGAYDRFVFLDSQDWMKDDEIAALWREVTRVAPPGSRVIFRSAPEASPVDAALPPDLRARVRYERERSIALFAEDRFAIYGGFHLYVVN